MKAFLSTAPLAPPGWKDQLGPNPPLLDSTVHEDLLAHLDSVGVSSIGVPGDDPLHSLFPDAVLDAEDLSPADAEPVLVVTYSGPFRADLESLLGSFRLSGADCVMALAPGGSRSSLPRIALGPLGRPRLVQGSEHTEPVTNLRDTGLRVIRGSLAGGAVRAGLGPRVMGLGCQVVADTVSCRYQRDLLSPESYLLCCYEMLTGAAGEWYGPCGTAPGNVVHPRTSLQSVPDENVWLAADVSVGKDTTLRRTVVLPGGEVGDHCRLDSVLVLPGARVPNRTDLSDKYLSIIGLDG